MADWIGVDKATDFLDEKREALEKLSEIDKAYLAGLLDGEGSFGLFRRSKTNLPGYSIYVSIANTNKEMIKWIESRIPFGTHATIEPKKEWKSWKTWQNVLWVGSGAVALMEVLLPYLVAKRERACWLVKMYKDEKAFLKKHGRTRFSHKLPPPDWMIMQRAATYMMVKESNQRGRKVA